MQAHDNGDCLSNACTVFKRLDLYLNRLHCASVVMFAHCCELPSWHLSPFVGIIVISCKWIFQNKTVCCHFRLGVPVFDALVRGEPSHLGGRNFVLLDSAINAENFIRNMFWSICSRFGGIHHWNVRRSLKTRKIAPLRLQGRSRSLMLVPIESLLWYAATLCLSTTIFTLYESISLKSAIFQGVPVFDAFVVEKPSDTAAESCVSKN